MRLLRFARNDNGIMISNNIHQQKSNTVQFSTFRVADELFGVDAVQVQEILQYQEITPVPLAPEYVKGLINLRGQIVTVLDLRSRLGFDPLDDDTTGSNLIVNSDEGPMSVFVDHIANVSDVQTDRLKLPPGNVRGVAAHYIRDICQLDDDLLIILDLKSILHLDQGKDV
jgi:purine-binding chemotaxis protein CheW